METGFLIILAVLYFSSPQHKSLETCLVPPGECVAVDSLSPWELKLPPF